MAQQGLAARTWMTVGTLSRFLSEKIEKPGLDDVISIARNLRVSIDFLLEKVTNWGASTII